MGRGSIRFKNSGSFEHLETFIAKVLNDSIYNQLDEYGRQGVSALSAATPSSSGSTANAWYYEITRGASKSSITWKNYNLDDDGQTPVVILLQYGHATGTGGYVQGRDFINPAIQPIMDDLADAVWKVVTQA